MQDFKPDKKIVAENTSHFFFTYIYISQMKFLFRFIHILSVSEYK